MSIHLLTGVNRTLIAVTTKHTEKSAKKRRKHCALAVVRRRQKNFAPPQTSRGRNFELSW